MMLAHHVRSLRLLGALIPSKTPPIGAEVHAKVYCAASIKALAPPNVAATFALPRRIIQLGEVCSSMIVLI